MAKKNKSNAPGVLDFVLKGIDVLQRKCSDTLNHRTRNWSRRRQKHFLFMISLVMGGISTYLIFTTTGNKKTGGFFLKMYPRITPSVVYPYSSQVFSPKDTTVFYHFHKVIDSMLQTPEGKEAYKSFLKERPGFQDSLTNAEYLLKQTIH